MRPMLTLSQFLGILVPPKEEKLGAFKVDGLNSIAMVEREFAMSKLYDAQSDKYSDVTLLSVEG